ELLGLVDRLRVEQFVRRPACPPRHPDLLDRRDVEAAARLAEEPENLTVRVRLDRVVELHVRQGFVEVGEIGAEPLARQGEGGRGGPGPLRELPGLLEGQRAGVHRRQIFPQTPSGTSRKRATRARPPCTAEPRWQNSRRRPFFACNDQKKAPE